MGDAPRKQLKTGVRKGGGRPPGYEWSVKFFDELRQETKFLNDAQKEYAIEQMRELARAKSPSLSPVLDVRPIEQYHELRDKGGVLGKINLRIYFYIDKGQRTIVVLGADKKEQDGQTSQAIKIRMRHRLRRYLES
jgi:hypothetical protein